MDEITRIRGSIREKAIAWALATAPPGEAAEAVLARAKLYSDWVAELASEAGLAPVDERLAQYH